MLTLLHTSFGTLGKLLITVLHISPSRKISFDLNLLQEKKKKKEYPNRRSSCNSSSNILFVYNYKEKNGLLQRRDLKEAWMDPQSNEETITQIYIEGHCAWNGLFKNFFFFFLIRGLDEASLQV